MQVDSIAEVVDLQFLSFYPILRATHILNLPPAPYGEPNGGRGILVMTDG